MSADYPKLEEIFIIDAVGHTYDLSPANNHHEHAEAITELTYGVHATMPEQYQVTEDSFISNWTYRSLPNMLFAESDTDFGVNHVLPVTAYKDGMGGHLEVAKKLKEEYPNRFWHYAGVTPLDKDHPMQEGDTPLEELERQAEVIDPMGIKLYPSHWDRDEFTPWEADDPTIAYPIYEKARELGIGTIAIHKSLPLGPTGTEYQKLGDVGNAARDFPDLNFEVVHGGLIFGEEMSTLLANQPNVYVNLETISALAHTSPDRFKEILANVLKLPGEGGVEKLVWGTGASFAHPQLLLEAFWDMEFPEFDGYFDSFTITDEHKTKILGENYANMHGVDVDDVKAGVGEDEFSERGSLATPFSDFERVAEAK